MAIVTYSIVFVAPGEAGATCPPPKSALVLEDKDAPFALAAARLPKSYAFPVVDKVI